jgi:hypothetical protein
MEEKRAWADGVSLMSEALKSSLETVKSRSDKLGPSSDPFSVIVGGRQSCVGYD